MLNLYGTSLKNRLLLGTSQYRSPQILRESILKSETEVVTVSLRRQAPGVRDDKTKAKQSFWELIQSCQVRFLPNTAGCRSAKEAITTAQMAREIFDTKWIKLEVIGNESTLQPDPIALVEAARELVKQDFQVFPYTTEDLVIAERLVHAGCELLMPWGAPIGSGRGLQNPFLLELLRKELSTIPLIVDAGIGTPSHAARAMEMGFDAILLNTAVSRAENPPRMAEAFHLAVQAGRNAFEAGTMAPRETAVPSTPTIGTPFWHEENIS